VIVIFTILCNLALGFIAYRKNPRSVTHRLLALITIIISLWSIANYYSLNSSTKVQTLFWIRAVMFVTSPLAPVLYLFLKVFPEEKLVVKNWKLLIVVLASIIVAIASTTSLTFSDVSIEGRRIIPKVGIGIVFFGISTIGFLIAGFREVVAKFKESTGIVKLQLKYLALGAVLTFTLQVVTNYILVVLFNISNLVLFGPTFSLIFISFITYAIVKHNLLNIKVLTIQLFSVIIWLTLFSKLFAFQSLAEFIVDLAIFVIVFIFGILLIRSVRAEMNQREELEAFNKKLKELDAQKDEFISMAAHELRAPMTAIKGYVSMIIEGDAGEIPDKARGFLIDVSDITDRLIRLVNNMLNVSRIEEGRMVFQEEEEHLSVPVRTVFNQFVPEAERKNLEYTLNIPRDIRDKVFVDVDRIQEVIGNLISNAIKYTDRGFVRVEMSQHGNVVRLEVIDSGPGISKEEQKILFQKFRRIESNVGKTTGSGLGLYISKLLVEKFNGRIGVISDVGKGSTFWFELPLVQ